MLTAFLRSPLSSPYNAHVHEPHVTRNVNGSGASTSPGAPPADLPGPLEPMSVEMMNEVAASERQARHDRMEAESRGWDGVFGQ